MNTGVALDLFRGSAGQIEGLMAELPDARLAEQFGGAVNHPAWTIPHLCIGIDWGLMLLGKDGLAPKDWWEIVGPGTTPVAERGRYPGKDEVMAAFRSGHEALEAAVRGADASVMGQELPNEEYRAFFPTVGHAVGYFLMSHEPAHLGQLADWRRGLG